MAPLADGVYYIKSTFTGHVLTISPNAPDNGAFISCSPRTASNTAQMWTISLLSTSENNQSDQDQYTMLSLYPVRYAYYNQNKPSAALARATAPCSWLIKSTKGGYIIGTARGSKALSCTGAGRQDKLTLTNFNASPTPDQLWEFREPGAEESPLSEGTDSQEKDMKEISDLIEKFQADPISNTKLWKVLKALRGGVDEHYDKAISIVEGSTALVNPNRIKVLGLNLKGLKALNKADFRSAVECFTEAITLDGKCSTSHANRSEAFAGINGKLDDALTDAENSIKLDPACGLGYHRKGDILDRLWNSDDIEIVKLRDKLKTQIPPQAANDPQPTMPNNFHAHTTPPPTDNHSNPTPTAQSNVFFTIKIEDRDAGRIVFKLFDDRAPYSTQTFRELAADVHGLGYKGSLFDVMRRECCLGGDEVGGQDQGRSIFTPPRAVEKHDYPNFMPGLLYLGTKTKFIDSRFVIAMVAPSPPQRYGSPIGKVIQGLDVVKEICACNRNVKVTIADSGCMP